ncbi:MAG: hypothetical protein F4039_01220 [Gammaproteobacteria bacterium]|nr:hypothetical protein [Gammaproteobacteria bacterium]
MNVHFLTTWQAFANSRLGKRSRILHSASLPFLYPLNKTFGYTRVSTSKQTTDPQLERLCQTGGDEIFVETGSGVNRTRPELEKLLLLERESIT